MENEEKKVGCCENKDGGKCEHGMNNCCHNWKKCHMIKRIAIIVLIILAFCIGTQWGEIKSELRGSRYNRGMMNSDFSRFNGKEQSAFGEVTVKVKDTPVAPGTPVVPAAPVQ